MSRHKLYLLCQGRIEIGSISCESLAIIRRTDKDHYRYFMFKRDKNHEWIHEYSLDTPAFPRSHFKQYFNIIKGYLTTEEMIADNFEAFL